MGMHLDAYVAKPRPAREEPKLPKVETSTRDLASSGIQLYGQRKYCSRGFSSYQHRMMRRTEKDPVESAEVEEKALPSYLGGGKQATYIS
jgi:hypothetical protein